MSTPKSDLIEFQNHYQRQGLAVETLKGKGRGIFTAVPIEKGEVIFVAVGRKIRLHVINEVDPLDYCFQIDPDHYLCPLDYANPDISWFVNHSCDGNMYPRGAALFALRDISAGEELTYDYALMESNPEYEMACRCGSNLCRRKMTGDDWKIPSLQQRYRGLFEPYLQKKINAFLYMQVDL